MARHRLPGVAVPEPLARYVAAEWAQHRQPVRAWKTACLEWLAASPDRRLPFGEHGDPVDVIREAVRLLRAGWDRSQP